MFGFGAGRRQEPVERTPMNRRRPSFGASATTSRASTPIPPPVEAAPAPKAERRAWADWPGWRTVGLGVLAALTFGAAAGATGLAYRVATTASTFELRALEIAGGRQRSEEELRQASGVALGDNLFRIVPSVVEERLRRDPWVQAASVERRFPDALRVVVEERRPAALLRLGTDLYVTSAEGVPFSPLRVGDGPMSLPVVSGFSAAGLAAEGSGDRARLVAVLALAHAYEALPLAGRLPLQEAQSEADGRLVLLVGRDGLALHLGRVDWPGRLAVAARVLSETRAAGFRPSHVFLDGERHPERVVVRVEGG